MSLLSILRIVIAAKAQEPQGPAKTSKSKSDHSVKVSKVSNPLSDAEETDLGMMTLESFRLWSLGALRNFLALRKRSVEGGLDELAARYLIVFSGLYYSPLLFGKRDIILNMSMNL